MWGFNPASPSGSEGKVAFHTLYLGRVLATVLKLKIAHVSFFAIH